MANQAGASAVGQNAQATAVQGTALGNGANSNAANSVALGANSVANQANTVSVGTAGGERRIVNVAAGVAPTDAVNVSQLTGMGTNILNQANTYTDQQVAIGVQQANGYTDQRVANANAYTTAVYQNLSQKDQQLDNRINNLTSNSYRGIACAIALVSAPRPAPGKTGIGFGTGYYMGNAATALTMAHSSRGGHWQSSFGVATSVTGNNGANIAGGGGILYQF